MSGMQGPDWVEPWIKAERSEEEHWQRFRDEAAMRNMAALMGIPSVNLKNDPMQLARDWADALVAELRANPWKMPE